MTNVAPSPDRKVRKKIRSPILTLNIDRSEIRYLIIHRKKIIGWGSEPLDRGLIENGLIVDIPQVAARIESLIRKENLSKPRVISTVARMRCLPRLLQIPSINRKLLEEAIHFESERQMPLPLEDLYLPRKILAKSDSEHQIFVAGAPKSIIDAEVEILDAAGLSSYALDLKPIALARAANQNEAVIIDLEPGNLEIILVTNGIPMMIRTLVMNEQHLTPEDVIGQAMSEVYRTVEFYNSSHPSYPITAKTPAYFTGKHASDPTYLALCKQAFKNPIGKLEPPIPYPDQFPIPEYATNIGLALNTAGLRRSKRRDTFPAMDLDLIPDKFRALQSPIKRLSYGLVVGLLLVLLAGIYWLDSGQRAESTVARLELENIEYQLQDVRQLVAAADSFKIEAESLDNEQQAILGNEASYVAGLDSIFGSIPPEVTPRIIAVTGSSLTIQGIATSRSSAIDFAARIEESEQNSSVNIDSLTTISDESNGQTFEFTIVVTRDIGMGTE